MNDTSACGTARMMVELYGKDAHSEARRRCEKGMERDDARYSQRWAAIASMIAGPDARSAAPAAPASFQV